jgi:hypothetical protein
VEVVAEEQGVGSSLLKFIGISNWTTNMTWTNQKSQNNEDLIFERSLVQILDGWMDG